MKNLKQAICMLKRNAKETKTFILTLSISIGFLYLFLQLQAITMDPTYQAYLPTTAFDAIILQVFLIVIILVCSFNCFAANEYYLKAKTQELCVYLTCGANIFKVAKFLLAQNFLILLLSTFFGSLLGISISTIVSCYMRFAYTDVFPLFLFSSQGFLYWGIILLYIFFFMTMINVGYAYRSELKNLLDVPKTLLNFDVRMVKIPAIVYLFLYTLAFISLCLVPNNPLLYVICCSFGFFAIQGILRYALRDWITKKKNVHAKLNAKNIIVSSMMYSSIKNITLYLLVLFGVFFFISSFLAYVTSPFMKLILCIGYLLMLVMMSLCIYLKLVLEVYKQEEAFSHLHILGFQVGTLQAFVKLELKQLWMLVMALPLPFAVVSMLRYVLSGSMSIGLALFVICGYLLLLSICILRAQGVANKNLERKVRGSL